MKLNLGVKLAVASAMLSASLAAVAQPTVPTQPPIIPATGLPFGGTTDPVYVSVFDPITGASLTEYLGLNASQIAPGSMPGTPTLDFGTLSGFSTFDPSGSASNLVYEVFSTSVSNGGNTTTLFTTSANAASDALFGASATNGGAASGIPTANGAINDWTANRMNAANTCAKANPCFGTDFNDPKSFALGNFGDNYSGALAAYGAAAHSAGAVGTSMSFFALTADNTDIFSPITSDTKYPGVWTLSSSGDLTYAAVAAVPLPAAAWLLLSGLASLGAIGRRRSAALVAA